MNVDGGKVASGLPLVSANAQILQRHYTTTQDVQEVLPFVLRVEDIKRIMGLSRAKTYEIVHQRGFPRVLCGKAIRIPRDLFFRWLELQAAGK